MPASPKAAKRVRGVSKDPEMARRKILDAAIDLFSRQGYRATSTEQVAEEAGYGQATVFFHFKTKEGLLKACLDEVLARAKAIGAPADASDGPLGLLRQIDDSFAEDPTANFFARMLAENSGQVEIGPIYAAFHDHIRSALREGLVTLSGREGEDLDLIAGAMLCMSIGVHAGYRIDPKAFSREDYTAMLMLVGELLAQRALNGPH